MKTLKIIALFFGLFSTTLSYADEVIEAGSNAYNNILEARDLLVLSGWADEASKITDMLEKKTIYTMDKTDFWGAKVKESGLAYYASKHVYIREDHLFHGRQLDINGTPDDFRAIVKLMFILVHESIHIGDFSRSNLPYSPEDSTYMRSFLIYHSILWNWLVPQYEEKSRTGSADAEMWRSRVSVYASAIHGEFGAYDSDEYGKIVQTFSPVTTTYTGCVKQMTHREFADYALNMAFYIERYKTYKEAETEFNRWAMYSHPMPKNNICLSKSQLRVSPPAVTPVGYSGPRQKLLMFEIERVPEHSFVRVKKMDDATIKSDISVDLLIHDGDINDRPRQMYGKGRIYSWQSEGKVYFPSTTLFVIAVVTENKEGAFPANINLKFTRVYKDENGNEIEGPLILKQLDNKTLKLYGYFPLSQRKHIGEITAENSNAYMNVTERADIQKVDLKKGDSFRLKVPAFDSRQVKIYKKLPDDQGPLPAKLDPIGILFSWETQKDVQINEDGTYYIETSRKFSYEENRSFDMIFEFSRKGVAGPGDIEVYKLSEDELKSIGMQKTLKTIQSLHIGTGITPSGNLMELDNPNFKSFSMFSLDSKKDDYLRFHSLPTTLVNSSVSIAEEYEPNKLRIVKTFFAWEKEGDWMVTTSAPHYMIVFNNTELEPRMSYQFNVEHVRADRTGPMSVNYKKLEAKDIERFGSFPVAQLNFKDHKIKPSHPVGFLYEKLSYKHYKLKLDRTAIFKFYKTKQSQAGMRFVVSRLDWDLYNSNQKALRPVKFSFPWELEMKIALAPGDYYLTLEAPLDLNDDNQPVETDVTWKVFMSSNGKNPNEISFDELSVSDSKDQRLQVAE